MQRQVDSLMQPITAHWHNFCTFKPEVVDCLIANWPHCLCTTRQMAPCQYRLRCISLCAMAMHCRQCTTQLDHCTDPFIFVCVLCWFIYACFSYGVLLWSDQHYSCSTTMHCDPFIYYLILSICITSRRTVRTLHFLLFAPTICVTIGCDTLLSCIFCKCHLKKINFTLNFPLHVSFEWHLIGQFCKWTVAGRGLDIGYCFCFCRCANWICECKSMAEMTHLSDLLGSIYCGPDLCCLAPLQIRLACLLSCCCFVWCV